MNMPVYKPILAVVDERETPKKKLHGRAGIFVSVPARSVASQRDNLATLGLS